jgi:D-alanyl-D-alanine carboxypeptidase/D-alanyl-D-alanine-endopeptidase (penicillin-binding protein 4)
MAPVCVPRLLLSAAFLLLPATARGQDALPPGVSRALAAAAVPAASVAIVVRELDAPRPSLALNAAAPMNPASVMKLVTSYAALELLGPAYRWKTEVHLGGPLRAGVLQGNLILRGGGDPKLDVESFWTMLRALRGKGLREIRGDLVLDRTLFERSAEHAGEFDGEAFRPYNVLPDALLVNFRSLKFTFLPVPETGVPRIAVDPRPPALEVISTLRLAAGPCPEGRAFREQLQPSFEPARQRAIFAGRYPASCGEKALHVALLAPNDQVAGVLRQLWEEMGGRWSGAAREGAAPEAPPFHAHESAPLGALLRDMNKFSNNVMARQIFLTLGAEAGGAPANAAKAAAAVRALLARQGIAAPELVLENGSGLSRLERASAATLEAVLQAAWRGSAMPEFIASLPIAAQDGTMRRRLNGAPVAGQAHIKTGLLADARTMAGYVLDRRGRRQAVVMLVNHPRAHEAQAAFDTLLGWVYEGAR